MFEMLKKAIQGTMWLSLIQGIGSGLKAITAPFIGSLTGQATEKIVEEVVEQFKGLLPASAHDEWMIAQALKHLDNPIVAQAFGNKLSLIAKWFSPNDPQRGYELKEFFRLKVIGATVEETAANIKYFAGLPKGAFKSYLIAIDIENKDLRTRLQSFWKATSQLGEKGSRALRYLRVWVFRYTIPYLTKLGDNFYKKVTAYVWKIGIGIAAAFGGLLMLAAFAYAGKWFGAFAVIVLVTVLALMSVESIWLKINMILPARWQMQMVESKTIRLVILLYLHVAVVAVLYPGLSYSYAFWGYFLILLLGGITWMQAFPSPNFYAPKVVGTLTLLVIAGSVVQYAAPAHAQYVSLMLKQIRDHQYYRNAAVELENAPIHKTTDRVLGWTILPEHIDSTTGEPLKNANGFPIISPCMVKNKDGQDVQFELAKDKQFRASDLRTRINVGEVLTPIIVPNADGSWIQTTNNPQCMIPISKTTLLVAARSVPASDSEKPAATTTAADQTSALPPAAKQQPAPTHRVHANAAYFTGLVLRKGQRVQLTASGKVNSLPDHFGKNGNNRWLGPEGLGSEPDFLKGAKGPLPSGSSYMALAARIHSSQQTPPLADGQWLFVGKSKIITADRDGYLHLVVNEKIVDQGGVNQPEWLFNNQGGFMVEVREL